MASYIPLPTSYLAAWLYVWDGEHGPFLSNIPHLHLSALFYLSFPRWIPFFTISFYIVSMALLANTISPWRKKKKIHS
jgi:hypothetical protein